VKHTTAYLLLANRLETAGLRKRAPPGTMTDRESTGVCLTRRIENESDANTHIISYSRTRQFGSFFCYFEQQAQALRRCWWFGQDRRLNLYSESMMAWG
jgi:hypothetical protein